MVLNSVPVTWVNQYNIAHSTLPKSPCVLLLDIEAIKHIMNEKQQVSFKAKVKEAASSTSNIAKGSPKKHFASRNNPNEWVLKNARPAKFCQHCKNKGGPHLTHTTNECCKYDKDGNPVAAAAGKPSEARMTFKKGGNKQMAYLMATIESLVKKGLKKAVKSKKQKRHSYDTSSSDSDLE
jgi:hypothetical protein